MSTLLIEPFGGMAGDMLLAALLDLGDPRFSLARLEALARELVPGECELALERASRGGIAASRLIVRTAESDDPPHRHFADLEELVQRSSLPERGRRRALAVLWRIALAEGRVHELPPEEVHFHEIGAVDTLIDVCGSALALELLGVERVLATAPLVGEGRVRCAHGEMPVPVPAVSELLMGLPFEHGGGPGERLTPTGAALLVEWAGAFGPAGAFEASAIGYGAGARDPESPPANLVRVQLGRAGEGPARAAAFELAVQLDDANGEEIAFCVEGLRAAGALDVWTSAVQMKKGRPGVLISALCRAQQRARLESVILECTPSLGLRWTAVERLECAREEIVVELEGERVRVKRRFRPALPGSSPPGERDLSPEHDDLARIAERTGASLRELERRAIEAARVRWGGGDQGSSC